MHFINENGDYGNDKKLRREKKGKASESGEKIASWRWGRMDAPGQGTGCQI